VKEFQSSVSYFKEGKFQEALDQINFCLEKEENSEYYFFRARVNSRLGNLNDALNDFDKLISIDPYNPSYINDRAVVLHLLKKNEEAMHEFDRAINLDPKNPYRYSSRAYFKDRLGDLKGAIEDYEKAIELDPEDAVAYNNKGLVEEKLGYQERAKTSFSKADDLTGYNPKEMPASQTEKTQQVSDNYGETAVSTTKKISLGNYFRMIKNLFRNSNTRKEFFAFVKSKFMA
jgi:tetratricopeptide (TPR) repeat protein